jgi:hypothetical protein
MQVFMKPNQPDAQWELVPYSKSGAITALGNSYDLRFVNDDGTEETRVKTPLAAPKIATFRPNVSNAIPAFDAWWETQGPAYGDENKTGVRDVFIAGYSAAR